MFVEASNQPSCHSSGAVNVGFWDSGLAGLARMSYQQPRDLPFSAWPGDLTSSCQYPCLFNGAEAPTSPFTLGRQALH